LLTGYVYILWNLVEGIFLRFAFGFTTITGGCPHRFAAYCVVNAIAAGELNFTGLFVVSADTYANVTGWGRTLNGADVLTSRIATVPVTGILDDHVVILHLAFLSP
jgi:hypothetical protein